MVARTPAIELTDVVFSYGGGAAEPALEDVSLVVERGEYLVLLGPNGGGKSTLLKLILGLETPARGTVSVLGMRPEAARGRVGYLPQEHQGTMRRAPVTVQENVLLGRPGAGGWGFRHTAADREAAERALRRVGLWDLRERLMPELSGGQRQRACIARALAGEPELLLLDEPLASVDVGARESLFAFLESMAGVVTMVMVSHDVSVISRSVSSVACVNRTLHHHPKPEITMDMARMLYGCEDDDCPVELVAHGLPHRVLAPHAEPSAEPHATAGEDGPA